MGSGIRSPTRNTELLHDQITRNTELLHDQSVDGTSKLALAMLIIDAITLMKKI